MTTRKEIIEKIISLDTDPRNGSPDENRKLMERLHTVAKQTKHSGWCPSVTQIRMCIHCVYRAHRSYEGGYCSYTDITGRENGIRETGFCTEYEPDLSKGKRAADPDVNRGRPRKDKTVGKNPKKSTHKRRAR